MPKCKKYVILCTVSIYAKIQKIIDSLTKENKPLHTPMNTPLCIEIRQGQFSWHLRSERTTCVSKERCLAVGRLIQMCGTSSERRSTRKGETQNVKLFLPSAL